MWGSPRARLAALALLVGACVDFGSSSGSSNGMTTVVYETPPRALDEICAQNHYVLVGDGRRGPGLTPDSCGFELAPGAALVFPEDDWPEILGVPNEGSVEITALVVDLDGGAHDAHWIHGNLVRAGDPNNPLGSSGAVRVSSGNQHLGIVDLHAKMTYVLYDDYGGCSFAHRRRAKLGARARD